MMVIEICEPLKEFEPKLTQILTVVGRAGFQGQRGQRSYIVQTRNNGGGIHFDCVADLVRGE